MDKVEITVEEYHVLARCVERVEAVERLVNANQYVLVSDILAVLGIEREKKEA